MAKDVYACLQPGRGFGRSNSGLVNRGGGLVVDTFWDLPHTRALIETYARVWKGPVRRVVNTHHNGDHCWGNQLFPDAEIIAHRLCAESFRKETPPEVFQAMRNARSSPDPVITTMAERLSDWDFSGIEPRPPTTVFDEKLELELDGTLVRLLYVGPAHTLGDAIVHLPESRVVFTGDVVFRLCTPVGWEGTFDRWIGALDEIIALEPNAIVPGHGPLCGVEGPREMKAYLQYVRSEARRFFDAGVPVIEAARRIDLGPYAGWDEPERIVFSMDRAYRELRGEPYDAPIDMMGLLTGAVQLARDPNFARFRK
ncbi:MAG: hypothetical protein A2Y95_07145 [Deltaproteobacteria bacterium RBG_13_65_10]|nr:MAG: hypothetical protein A2Y95_07145 [Deltaproteobacteria bacterium RBG_13_65_10]